MDRPLQITWKPRPAQNTFTSKQADPVGNKNTKDTTEYLVEIKPAVIIDGTIRPGETFAHALERNKLDRSLEISGN